MRRFGVARGLAGALAVLALAGLAAGPALAHDPDPTLHAVLDGVHPALPGVRAGASVSIAPEVSLATAGRDSVSVLDPSGRAFLRIGPGGVLANLADAYWYRVTDPSGASGVPALARPPGARARWLRVSRTPSWTWFDARLDAAYVAPPPDVVAARRPARLASFAIPLRAGGRAATLTGHVRYEPVLGSAVPRLATPAPSAGLTAAVLPGRVPGLFLQSARRAPVIVVGVDGEPFARLSAGGAAVNVRSPTWAYDRRARGERPGSEAIDARAAPVWRPAGTGPRLGWLDPRLRYAPGQPGPGVLARPRPSVLERWSVPVRLGGGRTAALRGETDWVPSDAPPAGAAPPAPATASRSATPWLLTAGVTGAAGALLAAGLSALRRRRRR